MKKNRSTMLLAMLVMTSVAGFSACMDNKPKDAKDKAEESNDKKFSNRSEDDAQFLVNAAAINLEEISLGQLAGQKGSSAHVKELAVMMVDMHTRSQAALTTLAGNKTVTIPVTTTGAAQDAYKQLSGKTGIDFDKAYSDRMVEGHEDAVKLFEKAAAESNDPDIKAWANGALPELRKHLDQSILCQKECAKM